MGTPSPSLFINSSISLWYCIAFEHHFLSKMRRTALPNVFRRVVLIPMGLLILVTIVLLYRSYCHPRSYCTVRYHWRIPGVHIPIESLMIEQVVSHDDLVPTKNRTSSAMNVVKTVGGSTVRNDGGIPMVIYQTYHSKHLIPSKVQENMDKYAAPFRRHVFNDTECHAFLRKHFHRAVSDMYYELEGPHRSDVFRYAILYIHGGVYIDIKTELLVPLTTIIAQKSSIIVSQQTKPQTTPKSFGNSVAAASALPTLTVSLSSSKDVSVNTVPWSGRPVVFTVLSGGSVPRTVFQGVLASPRGNPIFLRLIQDFLQTTKPIRDYFITTRTMYEEICRDTQRQNLTAGLNHRLDLPLPLPLTASPTTAVEVAKGAGAGRVTTTAPVVTSKATAKTTAAAPSGALLPSSALSSSTVVDKTNINSSVPVPLFDYYLFEEKSRRVEECHDGADRHKGCYFIFRGDDKVMKVRYSDYPWDAKNAAKSKISKDKRPVKSDRAQSNIPVK